MAETQDGDAVATEENPNGAAGFADLMHERIVQSCFKLYEQDHYKHAAREAMTQVELALKDASLAPSTKNYG